MSGSGITWAICKSAPRSRQITMPAPHHCFLQAGCPSCRPTNSVKALKAQCHYRATPLQLISVIQAIFSDLITNLVLPGQAGFPKVSEWVSEQFLNGTWCSFWICEVGFFLHAGYHSSYSINNVKAPNQHNMFPQIAGSKNAPLPCH